ncbi:DUF3397 domain-containing protein [Halobacillus yeomjeoni]|uniref:DUF3397 domain-containing protein n=1 Tax=Halobacillus yeomjeoni TaxID=311194 RepID=A0A931HTC0_9BACI|nr:DUF3397 domain-containing protein [Halobacillus yeomjeoni]MBH0229043.1 DUF3397 domain-containing protein [Halobacillus yeomjeoni]
MSQFMISMVALILTLPIPFLVVFYFFARKWSRYKTKAVHRTAHVCAPVFILAVHVLAYVIFEQSFLSYILIFLCIILGVSLIVQYKLHEEIQLRRAFKGFFRASFLIFTLFYMGLTLYGLAARLFS